VGCRCKQQVGHPPTPQCMHTIPLAVFGYPICATDYSVRDEQGRRALINRNAVYEWVVIAEQCPIIEQRRRQLKKNLRRSVSMSRWLLGPGLGWAGRAWAGMCCESEGRAAYDGQ